MKRLLFFWTFLFLYLPIFLSAQSWAFVEPIGGVNSELVSEFEAAGEYVAVAGGFQDELQIGPFLLESEGEFDIFLALYTTAGELLWVKSLGGPEDDMATALHLTSTGEVLLGGEYVDALILPDTTLEPEAGSTGIFVAAFDAGGDLQEVQQYSGTDLERLTGLQGLTDGSFYLGGYFADTLFLSDTFLLSQSNLSAFLSRQSFGQGTQWVQTAGFFGNIRASRLAVLPQDMGVVLSGNFQGQLIFAGDTLTASASGTDLFLLGASPQGQPLWLRGGIGAWDDEVTDLAVDAAGNLYLTGFVVGNLRFSEEIAIQSADLKEDIFVAKYGPGGHPLWAQALQDAGEETGRSLAVGDDWLCVLGHYAESFSFAGQSITSPSGLGQSALAVLDTSGQPRRLIPLHADALCLGEGVALTEDLQILAAGGFSGNLDLPPFSEPSAGGFDVFWAALSPEVTGLLPAPAEVQELRAWPNPVRDQLQIDWPEPPRRLRLFDQVGRNLPLPAATGPTLPVQHLPKGLYYLYAQGESGKRYVVRFVVVE